MANATKTCSTCEKPLPASAYYRRAEGRYLSSCKECTRAARRRFRAEHGERINSERRARYTPKQRPSAEERFWERVKKTKGCWWWEGATDDDGYGWFWDGKTVTAHRFSYTLANGPIPSGLWVLHSCDEPSCVNPAHLRIGTHAENVMDREERNPTQGIRGERHPFCRFSEDDVAEIRRLVASGSTQTEVAARFGTNQGYVSQLVHRRHRAHPAN